ncbi:MAG: hypothetical protein AAGA99_17510 [Actinomycetota bacterium]
MSDTTASDSTSTTEERPAAAAPPADERLAYRSVFQRLFVRPEVSAMIGAIGIWTVFWAVSNTFGTVGQTFGWLDIAASLGIMAVAVSMLMIGGEFDLSSGAMTGAMGILIIYIVKDTGELGGLGIPLALALPLSLAVALGIGYLNGFMVERTGQPSFIITLATFFALRGLKLGLSKRAVDQIQMGTTDEASDYDFFRPFFAAEWQRNDHQFEARDFFYTAFVLLGLALIVLAVCELWFQRRDTLEPGGLVQFLGGTAVAVVGVILLHATDGVGANVAIAALISVGGLAALHGFARWRYEPVAEPGTMQLDPAMRRRVGLGLGLVVVGSAIAMLIDSSSDGELFFPFTTQGVRAMLFVGICAAGMTALAMASQKALSVNAATKFVVTASMALGMAIVAATVFLDSADTKFRGGLFSVLLAIAVLLFGWAVVSSRFTERRFVDRAADRLGNRVIIAGVVAVGIGMAFRLLFTVEDEILAGIPPAKTSIRVFWFVLFTSVMVWVLANTKFGSWVFAVGGNKEAARQVGVPAARTKTQLFMLVAFAAWLVGILIAFRINSIQANTGDGEEFEYIIAAVVGGTLLTGGYGTAFGGAIGACIMAMPLIGISSARWNSDWRFLLLGVILLLAVVSNRFIRLRAEGIRR